MPRSTALLIVLVLAAAQSQLCAVIAVVDQENTGLTNSSYSLVSSTTPIGQEFVPALNRVDAVELKVLGATAAESALVNIRDGTITGPVLGSSAPLSLPAGLSFTTFDLLAPTPLTPGSVYVIELVALTLNVSIGGMSPGAYPPGRAIIHGNPDPSQDFWFREGIVPEPTGAAVLVGFSGSVLTIRRRRK
ncbi:MAG: hypothetical protein ACREJC_02830 [Tepidisphaeraceae bacterium]